MLVSKWQPIFTQNPFTSVTAVYWESDHKLVGTGFCLSAARIFSDTALPMGQR